MDQGEPRKVRKRRASSSSGGDPPHKIHLSSYRQLSTFGFKLKPAEKFVSGSLTRVDESSPSKLPEIPVTDSALTMGNDTTESESQNGSASILAALDKMEERLESNADRRATSMKNEIILKVTEEAKAEIALQLSKYREEDQLKWEAIEKRMQILENTQTTNLSNPEVIKGEIQRQVAVAFGNNHEDLVTKIEENIARKINNVLSGFDAKERREKKLNLVIQGLEGSPHELCLAGRKLLSEKFQAQENIENITVSTNYKTVCVTMKSWEAKLDILKRKKSILDGMPIFINSDLTPREAGIANKLRDEAKSCKADGKDVRIRHQKIKIGKRWYGWDEFRECLIPLVEGTTPKRPHRGTPSQVSGNAKSSAPSQANRSSLSPSGTPMVLGA